MVNNDDPQFGQPIGLDEEEENEDETEPESQEPSAARRAADYGIDYGKQKGRELAQKKMAERAGKKAAQKGAEEIAKKGIQTAAKAGTAAGTKAAGAALGTAIPIPILGTALGYLAGWLAAKGLNNKTVQTIMVGCSAGVILIGIGIIMLFVSLLFSTLRGNPSITGQSVHQPVDVESKEDLNIISRILGESKILTSEELTEVKNKINNIKQNIENDSLILDNKEEGLKIIANIESQIIIIEESLSGESAIEGPITAASAKIQELIGSLKNMIKSGILKPGINIIEFSKLGVRLNRVGPQSQYPFDGLTYQTIWRPKDPKDKQAIAEAALDIVGSMTLPISSRRQYSPDAQKKYGDLISVPGGGTRSVNCLDFIYYALGKAGVSDSEYIIYSNKRASEFPLENGDMIYFNAPNHPAHRGPESPNGHWVIIYKN